LVQLKHLIEIISPKALVGRLCLSNHYYYYCMCVCYYYYY